MKLSSIEFHKDTLEVINNYVSVNTICSNLGIDRKSQQVKIQADESFESKLVEVKINGITQKVLCIPYDKLNGWLFSINPNKVKPEVREKLIEYKNECFNVLHDYFNKGYAIHPEVKETLELRIKELEDTIILQNRLIANKQNYDKLLQENIHIKRVLIQIQNRYYQLSQNMNFDDITKEISRIKNQFQCIASLEKNGNNLNTNTMIKHKKI